MLFVTTPSSMLCLPGGPTTISLLVASLSKLLSARWWSPVQRTKRQWRWVSLGRCSSECSVYPEGSFLDLHMGALHCLPPEWLPSFWFRVKLPKSCWCCGWFYLLQTHTQGLFVRICSTETSGELEIWLFNPSLSKRRNKFQFPVGNDCSELRNTHHHWQQEREFVCCW